MKKSIWIIILTMGLAFSLFSAQPGDVEKEKAAIKQVILEAYRDGICNVGDVNAIDKGFHPGFNLLSINNDHLEKLPIYNWKKYIEGGKKAGKFPPKEKVSFKFPLIDVVGTAAAAKIEFYKGEKLTYTDFLSLYKFKDGWKLVAKIYFKH